MGAFSREVRFYRHSMARPISSAVPACYAAEHDRETGDFVLLFEDLSQWRTGDIFKPPPEDVAALLEATAAFHAAHWADPELPGARWLGHPNERRALALAGLFQENLPRCQERFPRHIGPQTTALAELAISDSRVFELLGRGPQTILHGDLHLQNAMFRDADVRVIDWQSCTRGTAVTDVGRLLTSSLETEDRRRLTEELVSVYLANLAREGVKGYDMSAAMADLGVAIFHSVMVYILAMPGVDLEGYRPMESATGVSILDVSFLRLEAALEDHETLAAVRQRLKDL